MYAITWWLEEDGFAYGDKKESEQEAMKLAWKMYDRGAVKVEVQKTIYTIKRKEE